MSRQKLLVSRCKEKTHRGNVYDNLESANNVADCMSKKLGYTISAFVCPICNKYHIGRPSYSCNQKESFDSEINALKRAKELRIMELVLLIPYHCKKCFKWHLKGG